MQISGPFSNNSICHFIISHIQLFQTFEDQVMFLLIGSLCGLAIYNGLIIDLKFPLALYKKILDKYVEITNNMYVASYVL